MQPLALALSFAAISFAGAAAAQTPPAPPPPSDHVLTRADAIARADARFAKLDTDHDGTLSPEERLAGRAMHRDMKADRPITAAEYRDRALRRFDQADTNHDGRLDPAERRAARDRMRGSADGDGAPPQRD